MKLRVARPCSPKMRKFTDEQIEEMRRLRPLHTTRELAAMFECSRGTVERWCKGIGLERAARVEQAKAETPEQRARRLESIRRWQLAHPERVKELQQRWRSENREHCNAYHRAYNAANPERIREIQARARAKRKAKREAAKRGAA